MPRNAEVIRQWTILREIERARGGGVTIDELASLCAVTTRTIRRDLQALEEAGFPLFDDKIARRRQDAVARQRPGVQRSVGRPDRRPSCARLYFSRTLLESLSGTPFRDEVESAFDKLSSALTPHMRQFLDQLPRVIATKADPTRRHDHPRQQQIIARALEATLHQRQASLTYHSKSSERTKTYLVHPYRLAYAQGGLYLLAYVPEYSEVRTFAVERIQDIVAARGALHADRGAAGRRVPAFARRPLRTAGAGRDRIRAGGRRLRPRARVASVAAGAMTPTAGGVTLTLDVCLDRALHSWILSFGPFARVLAPESLAREIAEQFAEARARYAS